MTNDGTKVIYRCGADIPLRTPSEYPKVTHGGRYLMLEDGREYPISKDPIKVLGLLRHLGSKTWATNRWLCDAIERIAAARGWKLLDWDLSDNAGEGR